MVKFGSFPKNTTKSNYRSCATKTKNRKFLLSDRLDRKLRLENEMGSGFPTTKYSLIEQLRSQNPADRRMALELFIQGYRKALFHFLTNNKRVDPNDAEDLVHEFIVGKVMSGRILSSDQRKGRFRNLLRKALQNHLIDALRKNKSKQKDFVSNSGLIAVENIAEEFDAFDRIWAIGVFTTVLKQMELNSPYWEVFKARVLTVPPMSYARIVETFDFENPVNASNALVTAKRTFVRLVSEAISESSEISKHDNLEEEIDMLKRVLLDSSEVAALVVSLDSINMPRIDARKIRVDELDDSISRELGPIVDAQWTAAEIQSILEHLLANKIGSILEDEDLAVKNMSIGDLLLRNDGEQKQLLASTAKLKDYFRSSSADGSFSLPQPVLVTVVYALIARFIEMGGERADVTSLESEDLNQRLLTISRKPWIGSELMRLFEPAI